MPWKTELNDKTFNHGSRDTRQNLNMLRVCIREQPAKAIFFYPEAIPIKFYTLKIINSIDNISSIWVWFKAVQIVKLTTVYEQDIFFTSATSVCFWEITGVSTLPNLPI